MFAQSLVSFFMLYVFSIMLTISCSDWFLIWLGLEINMMSFIAIIYNRSSSSVEISMKYYVLQSLGSGVLMLMFYSSFYLFKYVSLSVLVFKMGGGPFYFWFPYVCENISWGSCFMLMTIQKILPLLLMTFLVSMFMWIMILLSILIGAVGSMNQSNMKRLMAYSSVHHIGWMMLGNFLGEMMSMAYLVIYSFMLMGVVNSLMTDQIESISNLSEMCMKWSFILGMLSMGGMPPLLGFYLKWWMFYKLMMVDTSLLMIMILLSVLMFYVYMRVVYTVLMEGKTMKSWEMMSKSGNLKSMDIINIMGINIGMVLVMIF